MIKKIRKSLHAKLFLIFACILVLTTSIFGYQQNKQITTIIQNEALEKARTDLQLSSALIDSQFPGEWLVKDNQLYKGSTVINNNHELIDQIGQLTNGNTVTIFMGDTRIATNVTLENGERALGTQISEKVAETVLIEGNNYYGTADVLGNSYQAAYSPIKNNTGQVIGIIYVGAPDASNRIIELKQHLINEMLINSLIILIVSFVVLFVFIRLMTKRLKLSVHILDEVAKGNLTVSIPQLKAMDEIDQLLLATEAMRTHLVEILSKVKTSSVYVKQAASQLVISAEQTTKASEQISSEIQEITIGSEGQHNSIDTAMVSIKEISVGMQQTATVVQDMAEFAIAMNHSASSGKQVVNETTNQMKLIDQTVLSVAQDVQLLKDRSTEINAITEMISGIATQTSLLALNASIEAARAGEVGRGFTVVAQEVKKLAQQSLASVEHIQLLVRNIQQQAEHAADTMENGKSVVQKGLSSVIQTGTLFNEMADAIEDLSAQSEEISAIVQEVHANTDEMVHVMNRIQQVTEDTSSRVQIVNAEIEEQTASMEEVSASVVQLDEMANELNQTAIKFKLQ